MARSCVQSILKLVNSVNGMVGLAMILYSLWLIRAWQKSIGYLPFEDRLSNYTLVHYIFLGLGVTLCVITCSGHIAADTANGCCLYLYMLFLFLLMLEAGVTADIYLNHDWEEDFPDDPTGRFDQFKTFVMSNLDICKWISLSVIQGDWTGLDCLSKKTGVIPCLGPRRTVLNEHRQSQTRQTRAPRLLT